MTFALCAALLTNEATGADGVPPGQIVVTRLDGSTTAGPLAAYDAGTVRLGPTQKRLELQAIESQEVLSIDFPNRPQFVSPSSVLEFANGDRIAVEIGASEGEAVVATLGPSTLNVPLEALRGIRLQPSPAGADDASVLFRATGDRDLVVLTNGDRFSGQFLGLNASELMLDVDGREVRIPRERIAVIAFAPALVSPRRIEGDRQIVRTLAGWLTVAGLTRAEDGSWRAETAFGAAIGWPAAAVRRIQFAGDRVAFLSDLEPASVEFVPYFDRNWPVRSDRDVTGRPLSAGGELFAKGLGVHSRCRLTYQLDGGYRFFHAVAGLADSAGAVGSVEFAVEVDGREVVRTGPVAWSDDPVRIVALDVQDAETLVLTVDFGRNGDVLDRANWCDAVLVRKP